MKCKNKIKNKPTTSLEAVMILRACVRRNEYEIKGEQIEANEKGVCALSHHTICGM